MMPFFRSDSPVRLPEHLSDLPGIRSIIITTSSSNKSILLEQIRGISRDQALLFEISGFQNTLIYGRWEESGYAGFTFEEACKLTRKKAKILGCFAVSNVLNDEKRDTKFTWKEAIALTDQELIARFGERNCSSILEEDTLEERVAFNQHVARGMGVPSLQHSALSRVALRTFLRNDAKEDEVTFERDFSI